MTALHAVTGVGAALAVAVLAWFARCEVVDHLDTLAKLRAWVRRARAMEQRCARLEAELELARGDLEALRGGSGTGRQ